MKDARDGKQFLAVHVPPSPPSTAAAPAAPADAEAPQEVAARGLFCKQEGGWKEGHVVG